MKKNKKFEISNTPKKIPEKFQPVALVPAWLLMPLWFISLAMPNLIYSGVKFADTLHILKWTVTGVPIAVAVFVAGVRLFIYGRDRINIKIDIFGVIWALILTYCALQPLWIKISSPTAFVLEMVCFVTVWAFYIISVASFPNWGLRPVLLLANFNAAINVMFAELQIRNMNNFQFLQGTFLADIQQFSTIILPTPYNYIGNTAQQNMFGLWVAVATLSAVYLFVYDAWKNDELERGKKVWFPVLSIALSVVCLKFAVTESSIIAGILAVLFIIGGFVSAWKFGAGKPSYFSVLVLLLACINFWGLMNSTSRSATIALITGLLAVLITTIWKFNRSYLIRFGAVMCMLAVVFWVSMYSDRSGAIIDKTADIIEHSDTVGGRIGIWTTSYSLFKIHPEGVGIGQYKWHYLEGQRAGFQTVDEPWYTWQYTHWAHNEFLQFFCEGGYIGGIMLLLMWCAWLIPAFYGLFKKKEVNINAVWALGLVSLITFCAVFTRPFHRIENMVWIALGFAISNREFFGSFKFNLNYDIIRSKIFCKLIGIVCVISSIAGCVYISSGIYGNYLLRQALSTQNANLQMYLLEQANKHPIVREEVQRNMGHHYLQLGEQTNDREALIKGFNILWQHFQREPHSEDISRLLNFSQRYQIENVLRELKSYFKPGTYHLERRVQQDANGNNVRALLLINGPGSDDE